MDAGAWAWDAVSRSGPPARLITLTRGVGNYMLFQHHQRIIFTGDSITDSDRAGAFTPYGNGYVSIVRNHLLARYPERNLTILNMGVGGDTVRDLDKRWRRDVLTHFPNWVAIMIGMNDVWRHFTYNPAQAVPIDEYNRILRRLIQQVRDVTGARVILLQPFVIDSNQGDPMRALMDVYGKTMDIIANETGSLLVRTQAAFDEALKGQPANFWTADRLHPGQPGHHLIALEFLKTVQFEL